MGGRLRALVQAASALAGRSLWSTKAGITYEGKRNLYEVLGYKRILDVKDFRGRYDRNGVAARVVESKPGDTWRGGAELIEDEDPNKETEFEKSFEDLNKRLKIWTTLKKIDVLSGIGRYGVIFLGAPGKPEEELKSCTADQLVYLSCFGEDEAKIESYVTDVEDPRFGKPIFYTITRQTPSGVAPINMRVHYTRVIHVADNTLEDPLFGAPRLLRVWNLFDDLEKVTGGGAEAFWKRADQGMQFNLDPTMELEESEEQELEQEVENYIHKMERTLLTRGVEIKSLGSDVANFDSPARAVIEQISASVGIPQRILMGSEQAKLAAEQDRVSYDRDIESRRGEYAEPMIIRPFVDRLIELGVLPEAPDYEVRWSQIRTKSDAEKADLAKAYAAINQTQGDTVVTTDEIRERALDMEPFTDDQRAEIDAKKQEAFALENPDAADPEADPDADPEAKPKPGEKEEGEEGKPKPPGKKPPFPFKKRAAQKRQTRRDITRDSRGLISSITETEL